MLALVPGPDAPVAVLKALMFVSVLLDLQQYIRKTSFAEIGLC